jgi:acyl phosphate:glycerol-3-phosphate acyltransferase
MSLVLVLVFALAGYFVGSFSFSRLFVRIFAPNCDVNKLEAKAEDGESMKMLTYGANAVSLVLGTKLSMVVSLLDLLKIAVPMLILKLLYGAEPYFLFYSCTGLIGNNWPLFYQFKGGTGFSVVLGSLLVVDYWAVIATPLLGLLLGFFVLGNIGIANLGWIILVIPWLWLGNFGINVIVYAVVVASIVLIALWPEARRYRQYTSQGKVEALGRSYYESSSMARGMKKIMDRRNSLGKWKYVLSVVSVILFIMVFYLEYLLR